MSINPGVPRELDIIVARATARDAKDRFPTAGQMAEALREHAPQSHTGDIGGLVHHTQAIPIVGEETIAVERLKKGDQPVSRTHRPQRKNRRPRWLALLLLLSVIAATIYVIAGRTPSVLVPSVTNMDQTAATQLLESRGFKVATQTTFDPTIAAGNVVSQNPAANVKAAKGSTITLVISNGPVTVTVPDEKGQLFSTAQKDLTKLGFTVKRVTASSPTVKLGYVIDQDPSGHAIVSKGTQVTLTVSTGPELIAVPNVVNKDQATATNMLQDAGFTVSVKQQADDHIVQGNVISTNPAAGNKVAKGTVITMLVSSGPPPVRVPNLLCMTRKQAQDALAHAGLKGNFQGLSGDTKRVVDQDPVANSEAPKGSTVNVVMGYGATC